MNMMGMPLLAWIVFYALVLLMLVADLRMFGRKGEHEVNEATVSSCPTDSWNSRQMTSC